jgi:hypothetical protein
MPEAPKLAWRTCPEGGFARRSLVMNGAARSPEAPVLRNERRVEAGTGFTG